jgi:hypothetical protein
VSQRIDQQALAGAEIVDDERRADARTFRHVGDARVTETAFADQFCGGVKHLRAAGFVGLRRWRWFGHVEV